MQNDEVLKIYIRSSLGFKYDVVLSNSTGIIDADYFNNPNNEGHIWIKLINYGDKTLSINKGEAIAQGIFEKYLKVDNDTPVNGLPAILVNLIYLSTSYVVSVQDIVVNPTIFTIPLPTYIG